MAVYIGNARISEHGTVNGTKGDQTGKEVMIQTWSSGGTWQYVFRPKSEAVARKIADAMVQACNNNNIGYSQADRLSLYNLAKANGWKISKVGKCNCDCSSLVAVCCNAAGIPVAATMYTGNEKALLQGTGKFTTYTSTAYTKAANNLRAGDILLRSGHTAIVTSGAVPFSSSAPTTAKKSTAEIAKEVIAGKWGTGETRKQKLTAAGYNYATIQAEVNRQLGSKPAASSTSYKTWVGKVTATKLNVRTGAGTNYPNLKAYPQLGKNNLVDVIGTAKANDGSTWYKIRIKNKYVGFVHSAYLKKA